MSLARLPSQLGRADIGDCDPVPSISASCTPALEAGDARSTASIKRVAGSTLSAPVCCLFIRNDSETTEIDGLHQRRLRWVGVKWRTQQLVLLQRDVQTGGVARAVEVTFTLPALWLFFSRRRLPLTVVNWGSINNFLMLY